VEDAVVGNVNHELASWLMNQRLEIERVMAERLGGASPAASGPEAETLRRFRTFSSTALMRGEAPRPVLDGLRPNERRVMALLTCWAEAASELAGPDAKVVTTALAPLLDAFRLSIRTTGTKRKSSGRPRATRRAITAAIDLVSDLFFALDTDSGEILDANPAAGAALGVARDALIGVEFNVFVSTDTQGPWWTALDTIAEGQDSHVFTASMQDREGRPIRLEASATRYVKQNRSLALILARPATKIEALVEALFDAQSGEGADSDALEHSDSTDGF
jgi:PAS domain S-box-containing protein